MTSYLIVGWACLIVGFAVGVWWKEDRWMRRISDMSFSKKNFEMDGYAEAINDLLTWE